MQLISASQLTGHGCHVILDSNSCCVQDRHTGTLVGTGPRRRYSHRLWELDWLRLHSVALPVLSPPPSPLLLLQPPLHLLLSGIIV